MKPRKLVPPPETVTWQDGYRFVLGVLSLVLGFAILIRSILAGIITPPSILLGVLFIAFGVYRLYVGVVRYQQYRAIHQKSHKNG
jgi:uncharacterized membrane protein HdeD (DUF308 family)